MTEIESVYRPTPAQAAFRRSNAAVRGYGGAMGGGKTRAICEEAFDYAIDNPGIMIPLFRQEHTSIVRSTKRTMLQQVVPTEAIDDSRRSQGEDWVRLVNGSEIHFAGLSDPVRWYSSEIGAVFFDEAQEMDEDKVVLLMTRLRQRCAECVAADETACSHFPHRAVLSFNPDRPGHWLHNWFILDAERTEHGTYKSALYATDADDSLGDAEFFFAKSTDNPYLPPNYISQHLAGLPRQLRKRLLEGLWEYASGSCYFDVESLERCQKMAMETPALLNGHAEGDPMVDAEARTKRQVLRREDAPRLVKGSGGLVVFRKPVTERIDNSSGATLRPHRYVMGIDVSSGGAGDYSAIQVICIEDWEQVARFQGKLTPTALAVQAYLIGRVYCNALAVPEVTGGWGFTVEQELKRFRYPALYTRRILDRLSRVWTDKTGWDTTVRTRAHMLDTLNRVLDEGELGIYDLATVAELGTFVRSARGKPEGQPGTNDDLVTSLAIAVTVAADMPRSIVALRRDEYKPSFAITGY